MQKKKMKPPGRDVAERNGRGHALEEDSNVMQGRRSIKYSGFHCAGHYDEPLKEGIVFGRGLHDSWSLIFIAQGEIRNIFILRLPNLSFEQTEGRHLLS